MKASLKLLNCVANVARTIVGLARYVGMLVVAQLSPKAVLSARGVALQSQLAACCGRIDQGKETPSVRRVRLAASEILRGYGAHNGG